MILKLMEMQASIFDKIPKLHQILSKTFFSQNLVITLASVEKMINLMINVNNLPIISNKTIIFAYKNGKWKTS